MLPRFLGSSIRSFSPDLDVPNQVSSLCIFLLLLMLQVSLGLLELVEWEEMHIVSFPTLSL